MSRASTNKSRIQDLQWRSSNKCKEKQKGGGQYTDGTTDITRTVHFGEPSAREIECFTRVLQTKLVDMSLLSDEEVEWLNSYHLQVWEKVSPLLDGSVRQWLWDNTASYKDVIPV
ncbi:hypothetical protein K7X08_009412 [Anisodus acutangulus]|uniref:Peptidase M24 C-terminal domain-containing protein n=1 Tax=Anisodus acutangulus TaxID=402998 RepID=A0A9Q1RU45_9SOLA|nr:hypothetical protein K7X08_009412 [Anisodus acutangulus]